MLRKEETHLNIIPIMLIIILAVSIGVASTLTGFGKLGIAQGQGDNSTSSLTPEQRAAMCEPGDKHVNTTESRICGIPKSQPSNATTSTSSEENTTPEGIAPPPEPQSEG